MAVGYAQVILRDAPASYWRLGDLLSNSSATDTAGTVTGTYSGSISRGMPGAVMGDQDSCTFFLNGYVDMGNQYIMGGTAAWTVEAWVQIQKFNGVGTIAGNYYNGGGGFQGWGLSVSGSGSIEAFRALNGTFNTASTANWAMPLGQWTYCAATYDGTNITLYVNGAQVAQVASSLSVSSAGSVFRIANDGIGLPIQAMVDEVAVYTHALTATQILNHYNAASFLTNAPTYLAAKSDGTQVAQAGQINQSLGMHALTMHNTGTLQVGATGSATPGTTWSLATQWLDQPFTLPAGIDTINRVEVALQALGTGADVTASIQADVSGSPSGTPLASITIPAQFVPVNRARMVSLPLQVSGLTGSAVYHLVLQTAGSSGNTLAAPQGGTGLGTLQTSPTGATWTAQTSVQLIVGVYTGDNPPLRNLRESSTAWVELENSAAGRLVGAYEMIQGARTAHRFQYSGYGRMNQIL
ncbi:MULTISPECIES: LamG domain-containing protein [Arthrobacter]|uniref:LamG domain-containing protein n=1 Tax=Arthrobacter terricola TaxID=2547396 RepID=A0A4R5KMK9_9MICC|nr:MULTISPECIES: LamG domain-containing protein [Arthrobacter]MBT8160978.1 LamG domain-containing protein [Arthrobacter sp. GN70]TDF96841.1 LamG domain-containing protein [Arthrobacter terricola]